eukprot:6988454-Lingulodinium_polyedra.AAC.1
MVQPGKMTNDRPAVHLNKDTYVDANAWREGPRRPPMAEKRQCPYVLCGDRANDWGSMAC